MILILLYIQELSKFNRKINVIPNGLERHTSLNINDKLVLFIMFFIRQFRGHRQNVLGQLSGFWPLTFYPLPPLLLADHTKFQRSLSIQKARYKLI